MELLPQSTEPTMDDKIDAMSPQPIVSENTKERATLTSYAVQMDGKPIGEHLSKTVDELWQMTADAGKKLDQQALANSVGDYPPNTLEDVSDIQEVNKGIMMNYSGSDAPEASYTNLISEPHHVKGSGGSLDAFETSSQAIQQDAREKLHLIRIGQKAIGEYPWYETVENWAGLFAFSDDALDASRMVELSKGSDNDPVAWFNSADNYEKFIADFQDKPYEQKVVLMDAYASMAMEATDDNELKSLIRVMELLDPNRDYTGWHALDKASLGLDVVTGFGALATVTVSGLVRVARTFKRYNQVKALQELAGAGRAAEVAAIAHTDVTGTMQAALNMHPNSDDIVIPWKMNASEDINFTQETRDVLFAMDNVPNELGKTVQAPILSKVERDALADEGVDKMSHSGELENIHLVETGEDGYTISYERVNDYGHWVDETAKIPYDLSKADITYKDQPIGVFLQHAGSPAAKFSEDKFTLVSPAIKGEYAQATARAIMADVVKSVWEPLGSKFSPKARKSKKRLGALIQYGNTFEENGQMGRVFTFDEMTVHGVNLPGMDVPTKFTIPEYQAYVRFRKSMDLGFAVHNDESRAQLLAAGVKVAKIDTKDYMGVPFARYSDASQAMGAGKYFDKSTGRFVEATSEGLEGQYNNGKILVKLDDSYVVSGNSTAKHILVDSDTISPLPRIVLNRRVGYAPLELKNGWYFVKANKFGSIDNVSAANDGKRLVISTSTLNATDNLNQAKKLQHSYITEKMTKDGVEDTPNMRKFYEEEFEVLHDREMSLHEANRSGNTFGGGYWNRARKEGGVRGANGEVYQRTSPVDSMANMMNSIASVYPLRTMVGSMKTRWLKTASQLGDLDPRFNLDFSNAMNHLGVDETSDAYRQLKEKHSYIEQIERIPTEIERKTETWTRKVAEMGEFNKLLGFEGSNALSRFIHNLDHRDPTALARSMAFHTMLGGFNISQTLVQSMGATIAMAIDPRSIAGGLRLSKELGAFDAIDNAAMRKAYMLATGGDVEALKLWDRAGLNKELFSTTDVGYIVRNGNLIHDGLKEVLQKGTAPFRLGELMHRRFSFASAVEWYRRTKNLDRSYKFTEDDFTNIMRRQTEISLAMSRNNQAWFQRNSFASLPTQFNQISFKYMEAMMLPLGKGQTTMTRSEVAYMTIMQSALFGAAGVPFVYKMSDVMAGYLGLPETMIEDENLRAFVEEGSTGLLMEMGGLNNEGVSRFAVAQGMEALILDSFSDNGSRLGMLGAFGSVLDSSAQAVEATYKFFANPVEVKKESLTNALSKYAGIFSSTSNAWKAWIMYADGTAIDKRGNRYYRKNEVDFNPQTIIAQALGFQESTKNDIYQASMQLWERESLIKENAQYVAQLATLAGEYPDDIGPSVLKQQLINSMRLSEQEQEFFAKEVNRIMSSDSKLKRIKDRLGRSSFEIYSPLRRGER